jgi:acetyl-CoA carboxylase carboxyltransferase component
MRLTAGEQVVHVPSGVTGTVVEVDEDGIVLVRDSSRSLDWKGFWSAPVEQVRRRAEPPREAA